MKWMLIENNMMHKSTRTKKKKKPRDQNTSINKKLGELHRMQFIRKRNLNWKNSMFNKLKTTKLKKLQRIIQFQSKNCKESQTSR